MNDSELIQQFAATGCEASFRALVDKHLNLVYSAALRQVRDRSLAEEISQAVFILLARKARSLGSGVILAGWLYRTTTFVAARAKRSEMRRKHHEMESITMHHLPTSSPDPWSSIAPLLDEALRILAERDREAVLLHFIQGETFQQVGAKLGLTEEAARKRVSRSLDKLRGHIESRGFAMTSAGLGSLLAARATQPASAGLAGIVTAAAVGHSATTVSSLPALVSGTLSAWFWQRVLRVASVGAAIAVVCGLALVGARKGRESAGGSASRGMERTTAGTTPPPVEPLSGSTTLHHSGTRPSAGRSMLLLKVIAEESGQPIPLVRIHRLTVVDGQWLQDRELSADETGTVRVDYPDNIRRLDLGMDAPGHAFRHMSWRPEVDGPIPTTYTIRLRANSDRISGVVEDERGKPIQDAWIVASFDGTGDSTERERTREKHGLSMGGPIARTDDRGRWQSTSIPRDNFVGFQLEVRHARYRRTPVVGGNLFDGPSVTVMEPAVDFIGRVLDTAERPIAGASLVHQPHTMDEMTVTSDENGHFVFQNVPIGSFEFTVAAEGYSPWVQECHVQRGAPAMDLVLQPAATVRFRCADEKGNPVSGVTISIEQFGNHRNQLKWSGSTDIEGRLVWNSAPGDSEMKFSAYGAGWCFTRDITIRSGEPEKTVPMRRSWILTGMVLDAKTGHPVAGAKAYPGYLDVWDRGDFRAADKGAFKVQFSENYPRWRYRIEADGYEAFESGIVMPGSDDHPEVRLNPVDSGRAIRGVVLDLDGHPAPKAKVGLLSLDSDLQLRDAELVASRGEPTFAITDSSGKFTFPSNPRAHSVVVATPNGFGKRRVTDPTRPVTLQIAAWGRIEATIAGQALERPVKFVVLQDPAFRNYEGCVSLGFRNATLETGGRHVLERVPPQLVAVWIHSGDGIPFHHGTPVRVLPGETTRVVISGEGMLFRAKLAAPAGAVIDFSAVEHAHCSSIVPVRTNPPSADPVTQQLSKVQLFDTDEGRLQVLRTVSVPIAVDASGNVRCSDPRLPGEYRITIITRTANFEGRIDIPDNAGMPAGERDLGTVELRRL